MISPEHLTSSEDGFLLETAGRLASNHVSLAPAEGLEGQKNFAKKRRYTNRHD
jgi:hypothetical protein